MAKRRPSGDGMVRKRGDGRWEGRIVVGHKKNGTPIFQHAYAHTQKELTEKLHQNIERYQDVELTEDSRMTLGEWLDRWLTEYKAGTVRPGTLKSYRCYIAYYIKPQLGDKQVSLVTSQDVQKLYRRLKGNGRVREHPRFGSALLDTTINRLHAIFHQAMEDALHAHIIAKNPTVGATVPKASHAPKRVLTDKELDTFLDAVREDKIWGDFFYVELTTGLRRGELLALRWEDLDIQNRTLSINKSVARQNGKLVLSTPKTPNSIRTVLLPEDTVKLLVEEHERHPANSYLFPSPRTGETWDPDGFRRLHDRIIKEIGAEHVRFHDMRHTFATLSLKSGVDVRTLSETLGHFSAGFTLSTYVHSTPSMRVQAADTIGQMIGREVV